MNIREQIRIVQEAISQLNDEKSQREDERAKSEGTLEEFSSLLRRLVTGVAEYEGKIKENTANMPGCFGEYYRERIMQSIKEGGVHDFEGEANEFISRLKLKILDLDDIIADCARKIAEKNSILRDLKKMLDSALEVLEDVASGGE